MPAMKMPRLLLRSAACAAALLACAAPAAAQQAAKVSLTGWGGATPYVAVFAGGRVMVQPAGASWGVFAEYSRSVWGLICFGNLPGEPDERCLEESNALHAGVEWRSREKLGPFEPYLSLGGGWASPVEREYSGPAASLLVDAGFDLPTAPVALRLGMRLQARPTVGLDAITPVLGIRIPLR